MRLAPALNRSVSLLVTSALLTAAAASAGAITSASAAGPPQQLSVAPTFKGNTDSDANTAALTFASSGTDFDSNGANAVVTLTTTAGGTTTVLSPTAAPVAQPTGTPPRYRSLTTRFDLRQQPPGQYNAMVVDTPAGGSAVTYSCNACFTITGFRPTVVGIAHDTQPGAAGNAYTVSGTDFARGAKVTFEQGGVADPGVSFSYTYAAPGGAAPNPTANAIHGTFGFATGGPTPALGGAHDVVVTNTDGKRGVCTACLTIPQVGAVYRSDQAAGTRAALGQGATADLTVKGSGFTSATRVSLSTPSGPNETVARVTVNAIDVVDPQTLKVNVSVSDTSGDASSDTTVRQFSLTAAGPGAATTNAPSALVVSPRPVIDNDGFTTGPSETSPGVGSTDFPIDITGSFFQAGAVASFVPNTGITVKSFTPTADGSSGRVVLSIAAGAPLTARDLVITNPDLGIDTGGCGGCITPAAAPVLQSSSPVSQSTNPSGPVTFTLVLPGSNISTSNPAYRTITFPDEPGITVGTTVSDDSSPIKSPTQVSVSVTLPSSTTAGPKRVFYRDGNGALVKCTTPSGGECFTVDNLLVTAVNPNFGTNDGPATLTVTGTNFSVLPTAKPVVVLQRAGQPDLVASTVTATSSTSLTATVDLTTASPGNGGWSVRVTNPDGSTGICRGCFTIVGNQPTLATVAPLSPATAPAGGQKLITVTGTNFARGATLAFAPSTSPASANLSTVSSTFLSTTQYQFLVNIPGNAPAGVRNATFANSDGKSIACNACFTVTTPPGTPTPSPATRAPGSATFTMTITDGSAGATAFSGPVVTFDGTGVTAGTPTAVTAKSFTVPVTVAPGAALTKRTITVTNGDGGTSSCAACFTVVAPPTVTSLTPAVLARGVSNTQVTVTGTGFGTAPTLDLGPGVTISTTTPSANGTSLTAVVSVSATALPRGLRDVSVTNTDAANGGKGTRAAALGIGDLPGAPVLDAPVRSDRALTLTWTPPADDGGLAITGYTVTVTKTSDGTAVTPTIAYSGTSAVVSGLVNGTSYTVKVKATNPVGTGADSATKAASPARTPDAPTNAAAQAGDATASVTWTAPTGAATGGDPISSYTVTATPAGGTAVYPTDRTLTSASFTGLTNGTSYTFAVVATNGIGDSNPSAASAAVTPAFVLAGAPTGVVADAAPAPAAVALSWTPSTRAAQTPTTSYTVKVTPAAGTITYPANRTTATATVTGLTNGTSYAFVVVANNTGGASADSTSASATPYAVPTAPRNVAGGRADKMATISWDAPLSDGGRPVTGYTVTLTPGGASQTVTGTSATFAGLTNGTSYTASVVATNLRGASPAGTSGAFTPATTPGAPTNATATAGHAAATVSWTAPVDNGGAALTGYTVTSAPGGVTKTVSGTTTSTVVTGLSNNVAYTFTVTATNIAGTSPASAPTAAVTPTPDVAPAAPTGVTGTPGDRSAVVTFTPPAANGGSAVRDYTIVMMGGGPVVKRTVSGSPATITGLINGATYTATVTANNAVGEGPSSAPSGGIRPFGTSTLALAALPSVVNYGSTIALKGTVTRTDGSVGFGGVSVRASYDGQPAALIANLPVASDGSFSRALTVSLNRTYTLSYNGDSHVKGSAAVARRVQVRVRITGSHAVSSPHTQAFRVSGAVTPAKPGTTITLYRVSSTGALTAIHRSLIARNGTYAMSLALAKGSYTLLLVVQATPGNAAGSAGFRITRT
jgi:hypothetical protein